MHRIFCLGILLSALVFAGCDSTPAHPEEAEVKSKITGKYCDADGKIRLELLADGRYTCTRDKKNPFGIGSLKERCEGNYKLRFDEEKNSWILDYEKSDDNSNPFISCGGKSVELWNPEMKYVVGDPATWVTEPFGGERVTSECRGQ